jgi:hypothetical protein
LTGSGIQAVIFAVLRQEAHMKPTGKEFESKLSVARAEQLAITIKRYRQARHLGIRVNLEILPTPGCAICEAQAGRSYTLENVPVLPLPRKQADAEPAHRDKHIADADAWRRLAVARSLVLTKQAEIKDRLAAFDGPRILGP